MPIEKKVTIQFSFAGSEELANKLKQEAKHVKAASVEVFMATLLENAMQSVVLVPKSKKPRKHKATSDKSQPVKIVRKKREQVA